jgi:hypothetical protein
VGEALELPAGLVHPERHLGDRREDEQQPELKLDRQERRQLEQASGSTRPVMKSSSSVASADASRTRATREAISATIAGGQASSSVSPVSASAAKASAADRSASGPSPEAVWSARRASLRLRAPRPSPGCRRTGRTPLELVEPARRDAGVLSGEADRRRRALAAAWAALSDRSAMDEIDPPPVWWRSWVVPASGPQYGSFLAL